MTDADGDPVVTYRFIDVENGANTPFFAIGYTNYAQGATVDVSAAKINDFWIKGGIGSGSATFQVQLYDGYQWSAAQTVTAITENAPVVTASTTGVGLGLTIAASSIFSVLDANGDAITQYKITDATVGSATLLLNGVAQAENTLITVSAANGYEWSSPTNINVTSMAPNRSSVVTVTSSLLLGPSKWLDFTTSNLPISVTDAEHDPTSPIASPTSAPAQPVLRSSSIASTSRKAAR